MYYPNYLLTLFFQGFPNSALLSKNCWYLTQNCPKMVEFDQMWPKKVKFEKFKFEWILTNSSELKNLDQLKKFIGIFSIKRNLGLLKYSIDWNGNLHSQELLFQSNSTVTSTISRLADKSTCRYVESRWIRIFTQTKKSVADNDKHFLPAEGGMRWRKF